MIKILMMMTGRALATLLPCIHHTLEVGTLNIFLLWWKKQSPGMPPVVTVWIIDDSRRSSQTRQTHPSEGIGAAEESPKGNHRSHIWKGCFQL